MDNINDNTDLDLAIARVQLANAESDIRALKNARTNYSNRKNQSKAYKPNGVSSSKTSNFTYSNPVGNRKVDSFRAGERGDSKPNPRANEYRAGERGQGIQAPKNGSKKTPAPKKYWADSFADTLINGFKKAYLGK
jgi:hypothetical protein